MNEKIECERHPGEKVAGKCSQCGRDICRECLKSFGYFCGEECRELTKQKTDKLSTDEEKLETEAIDRKTERGFKILSYIIIPAVLAAVAVIITYKVKNPAGKLQWEFKPDEDSVLSEPALDGDTLLVGCGDGHIYALDKATGGRKWTFGLGPAKSSVSYITARYSSQVFQGNVYVTADESSLYALDTKDGCPLWKLSCKESSRREIFFGERCVCFILDFFRDVSKKGLARLRTASILYCVDVKSGEERWHYDLTRSYSTNVSVGGDILCLNVFEDGKNVLRVLDIKTGTEKWRAEIADGAFLKMEAVKRGILLETGESMHFVTPDGAVAWKRKRCSQICLAGGRCLCQNEKNLLCINLADGKHLWQIELPDIARAPVVENDTVFVTALVPKERAKKKGVPAGQRSPADEIFKEFGVKQQEQISYAPVLYALELKTGKKRWMKEKTGGRIFCQGGAVFVVKHSAFFQLVEQRFMNTSFVKAYRAGDGKLLWEYSRSGIILDVIIDRKKLYFTIHSPISFLTGFSGKAPQIRENALCAVTTRR